MARGGRSLRREGQPLLGGRHRRRPVAGRGSRLQAEHEGRRQDRRRKLNRTSTAGGTYPTTATTDRKSPEGSAPRDNTAAHSEADRRSASRLSRPVSEQAE